MKRKKLKHILIPNADWTIKEIDLEDPKVKKIFQAMREKQIECEQRKIIPPEAWDRQITI
jgi:ribosomal 30S subunit maturation factor RimM